MAGTAHFTYEVWKFKLTFIDTKKYTTDRQKYHELAEGLVIITSLRDFKDDGANFLSTDI